MTTYGGVDVWIHIFLTSALVGGEWPASRPGRFTPGKEPSALVGGEWPASRHGRFAPGTHCIGGWVDPRSGLDNWRRENSWHYLDSNSDPSVVQPVASRRTDCSNPAPSCVRYELNFSILCRINSVFEGLNKELKELGLVHYSIATNSALRV
jgi:hypothetical protein